MRYSNPELEQFNEFGGQVLVRYCMAYEYFHPFDLGGFLGHAL